MRKYKLLAIGAVLALVGLLTLPLAATAASNMRSGTIASVGKDEVLESSVYLAGTTVTVAGTVRGDVYCAGQNIDVTGTVEGDVICAGQSVNVSGTVEGDVRVAGQTVTVASTATRSLSAFGQSVTVTGNATVARDVTIFGTSVQLGGKVARDAVVGGQNVTLAGTVGRNVTAMTEQLALGSGARVGGDIEYTSYNQINKGAGAVVVGQTVRHDPPANQDTAPASGWIAQFWGAVYWFGAWVVLGLLLLALVPRSFQNTSAVMTKQAGWTILAGFAALIMTPIVAVMLMVTLLGIPAGIVLLILWIIAMVVACAYSGYALGAWIVSRMGWNLKWPRVAALVVGLLVLALLMLVPILGGLISFAALIWGLGGLALAASHHARRSDNAVSSKAKS